MEESQGVLLNPASEMKPSSDHSWPVVLSQAGSLYSASLTHDSLFVLLPSLSPAFSVPWFS